MLNGWLARVSRSKGSGSTTDDPCRAIDTLPTISCSREELETVQQLSGWNGFGCNSKHQVWPRNKRGFVRPEQRTYLQHKSGLLDRIVSVLLTAHPMGKDFYIELDGAFLLSTGERFLRLRSKTN